MKGSSIWGTPSSDSHKLLSDSIIRGIDSWSLAWAIIIGGLLDGIKPSEGEGRQCPEFGDIAGLVRCRELPWRQQLSRREG